jgi:PDZ domain-containing protein
MAVLGLGGLAAVAVAGVLPASLVADKEVSSGERESTPYARTPSSAQPVGGRLTFGDLGDAAQQFPAEGDVYFVTVTEPEQSMLSWWAGRDEPAVQFLTTTERFGVQTPEQRRVFALESMRSAEQTAQYVALEALGFEVELVPGDVLVRELVCLAASEDGSECAEFAPSAEFLEPGDRLLEADGVVLDGVEDLSNVLADKEPGDTVELVLDRPEEGEMTVTVPLIASPSDPDRTIVGFVPFDTREVVLPFELDIDTGQIGGPSAGLAFTLALIDELSPGELLGRDRIATTGTIELDGSVGAIGGLRQKASAVQQAGVEVFLVPTAQGEEDIAAARAAAPGLEIIPVADLDEALAVLEGLGGDPLEPVAG